MHHLTHEAINLSELLASTHSPITGAVVLFSGEVRNVNKGRDVTHLEYEGYEPMANKRIEEILLYSTERWHLHQAICVHRLGLLQTSDCAVVVITASMHRADAYEANRYIIDHVKMDVPIWKNEFFTDGSSEWGVNAECSCISPQHHVKHKVKMQ